MLIEQLQKEGLRRNLSPRTIRTYAHCLQQFLRHFYHKELKAITKEEIRDYLDKFLICPNTLNVHLNAIKFFFEHVLHKRLTVNIQFTKIPKRLPEFLTKEELVDLITNIKNSKHQLMIELMYGAGLRVSELLHLKIRDFTFEQNYGWVRQGKGRKDRPFIIPLKLKERLLALIQDELLTSENFLFCSNRQKEYSSSSLRAIIQEATRKSMISKNVHPHTLRHSFATYLIGNGYAVTEVQPLLGHSRLETTMIYVHMAASQLLTIQSPLDTLNISQNHYK